jgi:hypothetical protein
VIGWEQEVYVTSENSRGVSLCASITSQAAIQLDPFNLNVVYSNLSASELINYNADCAHSGGYLGSIRVLV